MIFNVAIWLRISFLLTFLVPIVFGFFFAEKLSFSLRNYLFHEFERHSMEIPWTIEYLTMPKWFFFKKAVNVILFQFIITCDRILHAKWTPHCTKEGIKISKFIQRRFQIKKRTPLKLIQCLQWKSQLSENAYCNDAEKKEEILNSIQYFSFVLLI